MADPTMPEFDTEPRPGESGKEWLARLIREGCPANEWCRLADQHAAAQNQNLRDA